VRIDLALPSRVRLRSLLLAHGRKVTARDRVVSQERDNLSDGPGVHDRSATLDLVKLRMLGQPLGHRGYACATEGGSAAWRPIRYDSADRRDVYALGISPLMGCALAAGLNWFVA
jgi:hypothetical protein